MKDSINIPTQLIADDLANVIERGFTDMMDYHRTIVAVGTSKDMELDAWIQREGSKADLEKLIE